LLAGYRVIRRLRFSLLATTVRQNADMAVVERYFGHE
jgi:hypothetical protein